MDGAGIVFAENIKLVLHKTEPVHAGIKFEVNRILCDVLLFQVIPEASSD